MVSQTIDNSKRCEPTYVVAIVGAGQRGLSTLERICALYETTDLGFALHIHVVDPGIPGQGVHTEYQPSHLITNTTTVQTTVFVDHSVQNAGPTKPGPTYAEWAWLFGCITEDATSGGEGGAVGNDTYTPRARLGKYLSWAFAHIVDRAPNGITVEQHKASASSIRKTTSECFEIGLSNEQSLKVDYLYVTTGHSSGSPTQADRDLVDQVTMVRKTNPRLMFIPSASSLNDLNTLPADARILICGSGLTAADVISMLTLGRGGTFERVASRRLKYVPSGKEPVICIYSRQGLPAGSKGVNQKTIGANYIPKYFTEAAVRALRIESRQLDWNHDLLPLLKREIAECYRSTLRFAGSETGSGNSDQEIETLVSRLLNPWQGAKISNYVEHAEFISTHLADDIDAAFAGNRMDPLKAVSEMLRDLNDVVRLCVDYAGLTPASHKLFLRDWVSINNRIAAGPPKERNMELLALIEAGVVSFFDPNPLVNLDREIGCFVATSNSLGYWSRAEFDVLIRAKADYFDLDDTTNQFFASGARAGLFAPFRNGEFAPGGLAIDRNLNVIDRRGSVQKNVWAMGYAVEGAHYYTYVLPCPLSNARSLRDAAHAARSMIEHAHQKHTEKAQALG